ncbi:MAG: universal stress protein [Bacillota bacterium]
MFRKILLVLGGTRVNSKAVMLASVMAKSNNASLTALSISLPESVNMLGDEWISDQRMLDLFFSYMRGQKEREGVSLLEDAVKTAWELGLELSAVSEAGGPVSAVISAFRRHGPFDAIVLPAGYISGKMRLDLKELINKLSCPVFIVPEEKDN